MSQLCKLTVIILCLILDLGHGDIKVKTSQKKCNSNITMKIGLFCLKNHTGYGLSKYKVRINQIYGTVKPKLGYDLFRMKWFGYGYSSAN